MKLNLRWLIFYECAMESFIVFHNSQMNFIVFSLPNCEPENYQLAYLLAKATSYCEL